jgi:hypothetical protein
MRGGSRTNQLKRHLRSVMNPLQIFEQNLLTAAIVEFRGPAVGVPGDSLSSFQGAVIFQKIRDAGRPKSVRRIVRWQSGLFEPSFEHVRAEWKDAGESARSNTRAAKAATVGDFIAGCDDQGAVEWCVRQCRIQQMNWG